MPDQMNGRTWAALFPVLILKKNTLSTSNLSNLMKSQLTREGPILHEDRLSGT